jgi:hypothetical protein
MKSRPIMIGLLVGIAVMLSAGPARGAVAGYDVGAIRDLSSGCIGQNAEVEQAVDPRLGYVYELWMGCGAIGFARSTDGGARFDQPLTMPGSVLPGGSWDPAIAVAPNGTVYASFMVASGGQYYPVVAASFDHGLTFPQVTSVTPPDPKNWGDRDFIAVGGDGAVYLTWDYGPERTSITYICSPTGSCAFATGDLNVVMQKSTDGGKTFGPMSYISPGFPASGADSAPLVVEPSGRIDVLYQGYQVTNPATYALSPAYSYFTSSPDGGGTWSAPVRVGAQGGTMSLAEWWIDGDIGLDAGGNLYATWDTQVADHDGTARDIGWLAFSTDGGRHWSAPIQAPAGQVNAPHIIEVVGGPPGIAYVGWLANGTSQGYAERLRTFSIAHGWLSGQALISAAYGNPAVWPGDTFGISVLSPDTVVVSWGSATPPSRNRSEIFATQVGVQLP